MNINLLSVHREVLYGISALLIILFHATGNVDWTPLQLFDYGYIGVDIFLMIGAYCLCYSIQKHSLKTFYYNRFVKLYLLWFIVNIGLWTLLNAVILGHTINLREIGKMLWSSTLVLPLYTGKGDCDWFTASLFQYYLVFPWVWKMFRKHNNVILYATIIIISIALQYTPVCQSRWQMDCFVSRFPIFVAGIVLFNCMERGTSIVPMMLVSLCGGTFAYFASCPWFLTAMFCPLFTLLLIFMIESVRKMGGGKSLSIKMLQVLGRRSFEAYVGGALVQFYKSFDNTLMSALIYVVISLTGCYIVSLINDKIVKRIVSR